MCTEVLITTVVAIVVEILIFASADCYRTTVIACVILITISVLTLIYIATIVASMVMIFVLVPKRTANIRYSVSHITTLALCSLGTVRCAGSIAIAYVIREAVPQFSNRFIGSIGTTRASHICLPAAFCTSRILAIMLFVVMCIRIAIQHFSLYSCLGLPLFVLEILIASLAMPVFVITAADTSRCYSVNMLHLVPQCRLGFRECY